MSLNEMKAMKRYLVKDTTGEYLKVEADTVQWGNDLKFQVNGTTVAQFNTWLHWREVAGSAEWLAARTPREPQTPEPKS